MAKLPQPLLMKFGTVFNNLTVAERERAMQLISLLEPNVRDALVARVEPMSVDEITAYLRAQIAPAA
jgi:hypothetical protein